MSRVPTSEEWWQLYQMAQEQAIVALLLGGIERQNEFSSNSKPDIVLLCEWTGMAMVTEEQNKRMNRAVQLHHRLFSDTGKRYCILKGQGMARLYPEPLQRQSGDIDVWVEGSRKETIRFLRDNHLRVGKVLIHHVETTVCEDIETEMHFMPMWLYNPVHDRRLQRYFEGEQERQFLNYDEKVGFCHTTTAFNAVYCLIHLFHHLLDEGVGLRQVVDYYFVLKNCYAEKSDKADLLRTLQKLGMERFARGMMWVLKEVCDMDEQYMLAEPDEKTGRRILEEMMLTGNFGHSDTRYERKTNESALERNLRKSRRWRMLVKDYPSEVLSIPAWKLWHWGWRKMNVKKTI